MLNDAVIDILVEIAVIGTVGVTTLESLDVCVGLHGHEASFCLPGELIGISPYIFLTRMNWETRIYFTFLIKILNKIVEYMDSLIKIQTVQIPE